MRALSSAWESRRSGHFFFTRGVSYAALASEFDRLALVSFLRLHFLFKFDDQVFDFDIFEIFETGVGQDDLVGFFPSLLKEEVTGSSTRKLGLFADICGESDLQGPVLEELHLGPFLDVNLVCL